MIAELLPAFSGFAFLPACSGDHAPQWFGQAHGLRLRHCDLFFGLSSSRTCHFLRSDKCSIVLPWQGMHSHTPLNLWLDGEANGLSHLVFSFNRVGGTCHLNPPHQQRLFMLKVQTRCFATDSQRAEHSLDHGAVSVCIAANSSSQLSGGLPLASILLNTA